MQSRVGILTTLAVCSATRTMPHERFRCLAPCPLFRFLSATNSLALSFRGVDPVCLPLCQARSVPRRGFEAKSTAPGQLLQQSPLLKAIGEDYIAEAFRAAHEADPDAILICNDNGITRSSP